MSNCIHLDLLFVYLRGIYCTSNTAIKPKKFYIIPHIETSKLIFMSTVLAPGWSLCNWHFFK